MTGARELLVGDTSFISSLARAVEHPQLGRTWPRAIAHRLSSARFAISTVTFAEMRYGHRIARWGGRRVSIAERWLATFVQFPVDADVAETWARLKANGQRRGRSFGVNDLWIAATGCTRGIPIVTCDRGFPLMPDLGVEVIYLPRTEDARGL